jgi:hypothetical protein
MINADSTIQKLLKLRFKLGEFGCFFSIESAMLRCGEVPYYMRRNVTVNKAAREIEYSRGEK